VKEGLAARCCPLTLRWLLKHTAEIRCPPPIRMPSEEDYVVRSHMHVQSAVADSCSRVIESLWAAHHKLAWRDHGFIELYVVTITK
jgi:hypothetical protein